MCFHASVYENTFTMKLAIQKILNAYLVKSVVQNYNFATMIFVRTYSLQMTIAMLLFSTSLL
jgi:hypothetical protein